MVAPVLHNHPMPSSFGWLAVDPDQRRQMIDAVDLFRDSTTIDDLGIGGIRDAFSDALFPGTSTLHTRLRYALFIPWLLQASMHRASATSMQLSFRDHEFSLISALQRGGEGEGVIGRTAGRGLQRLPSVVYWGGLQSWGIIERGLSVRSCCERAVLLQEQHRREPESEDPEVGPDLVPTGIDTGLPSPPEKLLSTTDFTLVPREAEYLSELITRTRPTSLLAHLIEHRPSSWTDLDSAPDAPWSEEVLQVLPPALARLVVLAERFSRAVLGANLLYNVLLADSSHRDDREELGTHYRDRLAAWQAEQDATSLLSDEDRSALVDLVGAQRRRISGATKIFLDQWCGRALSVPDVAADATLRDLVRGRERSVKGGRARLGNVRALDAWNGASGTQLMTLRWGIARSHLQDLYDAKGTV